MAVGVRGIYRKWYNLVDDVKTIRRGRREPSQDAAELRRLDRQALLQGHRADFEKRFSRQLADHRQLHAFPRRGTGNGNTFSNYSSFLFDWPGYNCNVNGIGAIPCTQAAGTNSYGVAPYDRTHILNAFVAYSYSLPIMNLTAAPSVVWQSGLPYQEQRSFAFPDGSRPNYLYTPRGSSRLPSYATVNFSLEATFKPFGNGSTWLIGGPIELGVKGEVFNLFNDQTVYRTDFIQLLPSRVRSAEDLRARSSALRRPAALSTRRATSASRACSASRASETVFEAPASAGAFFLSTRPSAGRKSRG